MLARVDATFDWSRSKSTHCATMSHLPGDGELPGVAEFFANPRQGNHFRYLATERGRGRVRFNEWDIWRQLEIAGFEAKGVTTGQVEPSCRPPDLEAEANILWPHSSFDVGRKWGAGTRLSEDADVISGFSQQPAARLQHSALGSKPGKAHCE
jgi:hypothetical protein